AVPRATTPPPSQAPSAVPVTPARVTPPAGPVEKLSPLIAALHTGWSTRCTQNAVRWSPKELPRWTSNVVDVARLSGGCSIPIRPSAYGDRGTVSICLNGSEVASRNLSDLRQRQSRLFCLLPARCRIRLKHGFGSGGEVGIEINTLPEPTVLVESRTGILSMSMGRNKRQYLISKNGYL